jgi:hypothetical protein
LRSGTSRVWFLPLALPVRVCVARMRVWLAGLHRLRLRPCAWRAGVLSRHGQCRLRHLRRLRWLRARSNNSEQCVLAQCICVRALTSGACWHSAFACELLSVYARTSGVGCSDGTAQAAGPGTGDPYVGGPGIKVISMAASPGAGYPGASNFGTGGSGPGDSGKRCLGQSRCAGF